MNLLRHDLHILTGGYVLDALDGDSERDRFERHLGRCPSCAGEVRGLREVTTMLAMAVALQPPAALRQQVVAAVRRTRQLPPATEARPRRRWWPGLQSAWYPRLALAAGAAALAAATVLGVMLAGARQQLGAARAESSAIAGVLSAPDARVLTRAASTGGTATVIVSWHQRELIVATARLRRLPAGRVYELWLINPRRIRPAGLLAVAGGGRTRPLLATGLIPGDELGLTAEPAGGTALPTTTPILVIPLRA